MPSPFQELLGDGRLVLHDQGHDEHENVERIEQLQLDCPLAGLLVQMIGGQFVEFGNEQRATGEQVETDADGAIEGLMAAHQIEGDHAEVVVEQGMRVAGVLAIGSKFVEN